MDRVLAEVDDHFIRLMRNWARATLGANLYSMTTAYSGMLGGDAYDAGMPVLQGEVTDVDVAFQAVPSQERAAVQLYWLYEGKSYRWLAGKLGCAHPTVVERCIRGHVWLKMELARRRALYGKITEWLKNT